MAQPGRFYHKYIHLSAPACHSSLTCSASTASYFWPPDTESKLLRTSRQPYAEPCIKVTMKTRTVGNSWGACQTTHKTKFLYLKHLMKKSASKLTYFLCLTVVKVSIQSNLHSLSAKMNLYKHIF